MKRIRVTMDLEFPDYDEYAWIYQGIFNVEGKSVDFPSPYGHPWQIFPRKVLKVLTVQGVPDA